MQKIKKTLSSLKLPRLFDEQEQSEPQEIWASSLLAGQMLWPKVKDERSRSLYLTLAFRKIHDILLETDKKHANQIFTGLLETYFGGWSEYSQKLVLVNFPTSGKGSFAERAWQGTLAGDVFRHAFDHAVSLNTAAETVSECARTDLQSDEFVNVLKPSPGNIMKNYWPRFQNVAHFWAATAFFVMPEATDSIIRLDKAMPIPDAAQLRPGWRGIMDVAHHYLEKSADVKRYKTHKALLDQEKAFRVMFTG